MVGKTAIKDNTLKSTKHTSDNENYNLKNKLLSENKIDKQFIEKVKLLKLEDLITLKLITTAESLGGKFFNFPLLKFTNDICRDAIYQFAISVSKNRREASLILGVKKIKIINYIKELKKRGDFKC